ncbi:MAG: hypothetical protein HYV04_14785 [Deltaproteobacteria bacterium]|nr:hypothetical protein [Deltaproteobacteria bacterium]
MKQSVSVAGSSAAILVFLLGTVLFSPQAQAVVGDVTLTGLPPNTIVSLTDEKTGQKEEGRTDDRGVVVIPLGRRNWERGSYTVTARNPSLFPGTPSRRIQLSDGPNRVDMSGLVPFVGGVVPRLGHAVGVSVDSKFFDQRGFETASPGFSLKVHPAIPFLQETFTLSPYVKFSVIPDIQGDKDDRFDHKGIFQNVVDGGHMFSLMGGLAHESDLEKWRISPRRARIYGGLYAEAGFVHYNLNMRRLEQPKAPFIEARNFDTDDTGFRVGFGGSIRAQWASGLTLGLRGGPNAEFTDILNGGRKWRWRGNTSLFLGYVF